MAQPRKKPSDLQRPAPDVRTALSALRGKDRFQQSGLPDLPDPVSYTHLTLPTSDLV